MDKLPSDKFILDSLRKGDVKVFRQLFDFHYGGLVRFAIRLVNKPEVAEEIVLDVLERLWSRRDEIQVNVSLSSYLYSSIRYRCINYFKSRIQSFVLEDDVLQLDQVAEITPHEELVYKDLEEALINSINTLPEQCRIIFNLSRNSGLNNAEIAKELGIAPKTVENQMTIALRKIREFLQKHWYVIFSISVWGHFIFHLT